MRYQSRTKSETQGTLEQEGRHTECLLGGDLGEGGGKTGLTTPGRGSHTENKRGRQEGVFSKCKESPWGEGSPSM